MTFSEKPLPQRSVRDDLAHTNPFDLRRRPDYFVRGCWLFTAIVCVGMLYLAFRRSPAEANLPAPVNEVAKAVPPPEPPPLPRVDPDRFIPVRVAQPVPPIAEVDRQFLLWCDQLYRQLSQATKWAQLADYNGVGRALGDAEAIFVRMPQPTDDFALSYKILKASLGALRNAELEDITQRRLVLDLKRNGGLLRESLARERAEISRSEELLLHYEKIKGKR